MAQIVGKYQYVSSENFEEYMKALGQQEVVGPLMKTTPVVEIKQDGDQWVIAVDNNGKVATSSFKLGETYDEQFPSYPTTLKSVTTKEGSSFKTETVLPGAADRKSVRLYQFTDDGMTVHLTETKSGVKATRTYKRL